MGGLGREVNIEAHCMKFSVSEKITKQYGLLIFLTLSDQCVYSIFKQIILIPLKGKGV